MLHTQGEEPGEDPIQLKTSRAREAIKKLGKKLRKSPIGILIPERKYYGRVTVLEEDNAPVDLTSTSNNNEETETSHALDEEETSRTRVLKQLKKLGKHLRKSPLGILIPERKYYGRVTVLDEDYAPADLYSPSNNSEETEAFYEVDEDESSRDRVLRKLKKLGKRVRKSPLGILIPERKYFGQVIVLEEYYGPVDPASEPKSSAETAAFNELDESEVVKAMYCIQS